MQERRIRTEESGQRLDKFLRRYLPEASSGFLYKMLRKKNITVNRERSEGNRILEEGDRVQFFLSEETIRQFQGATDERKETLSGTPLSRERIVYEDEACLIVNKPAGMLTQRAYSGEDSLTEHVLSYLRKSRGWDEEQWRSYRPGPVNRLDRNTSGLVVVPLQLSTARELSSLFRTRAIRKEYLVLIHGKWQGEATQRAWLTRSEKERISRIHTTPVEGAAPIELRCRAVTATKDYSLLAVDLKTGKTHQIRAQLQAAGYPVVGDPKYGTIQKTDADRALRRQALHAWRLTFPEKEGPLAALSGRTIRAPLPDDLEQICGKVGILTNADVLQ